MSYNRNKNWKKKQSKKSSSSLMEGFGMFYKDNEESGFSFEVYKFQSSQIVDDLLKIYNGCEKLWEFDYQYIQNITDRKLREEFKQQLIIRLSNELEDSITKWNSYQNITKRIGTSYQLSWDNSDMNFIDMVSKVMYGILFLINMGEIKNDNYNGFKFTKQYQMVS